MTVFQFFASSLLHYYIVKSYLIKGSVHLLIQFQLQGWEVSELVREGSSSYVEGESGSGTWLLFEPNIYDGNFYCT